MAGSNTLRFDVIGDASSAARAFRETADGAALAARGAKQLSDSLALQSKSAQVSAAATLALAKSDSTLRDAEALLAGTVDEATNKLQSQGRAAEDTAAKVRLAGTAAASAGGGFGALGTPLGAAVAAGIALSPVLATVATGLGGLGLAAYAATKNSKEMGTVLAPLKTEFTQFTAALQPEVLTLFNQGVGIAAGLLKETEPVAAATGKALEGVLSSVGAEFRSGEWQQFFGFMAQNAGPDIQLLGQLVVDLTNDLPPLLEDLQPVARAFLQVADGAAKASSVLEAMNPAITQNAQSADKAAQSNRGFFGTIVKWIDDAKNIQAQVLGIKQSTDQAAASIGKSGSAAAAAAPQVGTLAGDMALLSTSTTDAATDLNAYNDAWAKIIGSSLSDQQAVLADESAFTGFTTAVKQNGASSLQARQAFVSYLQQVGSGISTLLQNGASVAQVNAEYETNIKRLQSLHGLTPQQRADVQGLVKDYDLWANSTAGLDKQLLGAASAIGGNFEGELASLGKTVPGLSGAVSNFADAILKTGTDSAATAGDRAALVGDLEKAGVSAGTAKGLVQALQAQIDGLHGKVVPISVQISEALVNQVQAGGATNAVLRGGGFAAGGVVQASSGMLVTGGTPGRDSVLIRAMPGEVVVPTAMVKAGAVDHLRGKLPGFAAGGQVVPAQYQPGGSGGWAGGGAGSRRLSADAQAIVAALEANTAAVLAQGPAVARSLNSVSAAAASRGSYTTRR